MADGNLLFFLLLFVINLVVVLLLAALGDALVEGALHLSFFHLLDLVVVEGTSLCLLLAEGGLLESHVVRKDEEVDDQVDEHMDQHEQEDDIDPVWIDLLVVSLDSNLGQGLTSDHGGTDSIGGEGALLGLLDDSDDGDCATCCVVKDKDTSVLENVRESLNCDVLVDDHVLQLLEWTVVEVGVDIKDGVLEVPWILSLLGVDIEEDRVTLLNADNWVVQSLTC